MVCLVVDEGCGDKARDGGMRGRKGRKKGERRKGRREVRRGMSFFKRTVSNSVSPAIPGHFDRVGDMLPPPRCNPSRQAAKVHCNRGLPESFWSIGLNTGPGCTH